MRRLISTVIKRATLTSAALAMATGLASAATEKLNVVAVVKALDQLFIADAVGFLKEEGVTLETQYANGAQQGLQLVANGNGDIFMGVLDPLLLGWEKGLRGKVIFFTRNSLIYTVAVPENSPIASVKDLVGKKIGVPNLAGGMIPIVKSMLKENGHAGDSVEFVPVGVGDQALAALKSKQVDGLAIWDTMYWTYESVGEKFRYFAHPTLANFGNGMAFVNKDVVANKKEALCRFGRAYAKAALFINTNPEAALRLWWKETPTARPAGTDEEALAKALPAIKKIAGAIDMGFPPQANYGTASIDQLQRFINALVEDGRITKAPPVSEVYTDEFVKCINQFDSAKVRELARNYQVK